MVCLVTGLVMTSPWVFYQVWAFVAAGLYRHERHYVMKYLPISLGLFLTGVILCFWFVLPITLGFLLEFNVWLGVAPTLRLSEWMSFATMLPLVFGIAFQTPLVMLFLERIGIFTVDDYKAKRKMAILIITVAAAVLTPGQDPFSMTLLAIPMILLYELGILLIGTGKKRVLAG
jgi:sec-independent protein translocase protein TatC